MSNAELRSSDAGGALWSGQVCGVDCDDNFMICDPGVEQCWNGDRRVCRSDGLAWVVSDCVGGCEFVPPSGAVCVVADGCTPGEGDRCSSVGDVERCLYDSGSRSYQWGVGEDCSSQQVCTMVGSGAQCVEDVGSCVGIGQLSFVGSPRLKDINGQTVSEITSGDVLRVEQDFRTTGCGDVWLEAGVGRVGGLSMQSAFVTDNNCNGDTTNFANDEFFVPVAGDHTVTFYVIPEGFGSGTAGIGFGTFSAWTAHVTRCGGSVISRNPSDDSLRFVVNPKGDEETCGDGEYQASLEDCDYDEQSDRTYYGGKGCSDFGSPAFTGGVLSCTNECTISTAACTRGGSDDVCDIKKFPASWGKFVIKDDCEDAKLVGWLLLLVVPLLMVALLKGVGKR